ncbi:MAG: DUF6580 family putative transport protein [Gemmataceae bacterium]
MRCSCFRPLALSLTLAVILTRLLPEDYRLLNFSAAGAVALFTAARMGWFSCALITAGGMIASDLLLWYQHQYDAEYLPMPSVYLSIAVYALLAGLFLRRSENPLKIAGVAISGSVCFFVITNFFSWLAQALPYGYSFEGLLNCYKMGVPFFRGTFSGDLAFTGILFGAHAVLSRVFNTERVQTGPQPVVAS